MLCFGLTRNRSPPEFFLPTFRANTHLPHCGKNAPYSLANERQTRSNTTEDTAKPTRLRSKGCFPERRTTSPNIRPASRTIPQASQGRAPLHTAKWLRSVQSERDAPSCTTQPYSPSCFRIARTHSPPQAPQSRTRAEARTPSRTEEEPIRTCDRSTRDLSRTKPATRESQCRQRSL